MNERTATLSDFTIQIREIPGRIVKFELDGIPIKPGYHITELRYAEIKSIDCGRDSDIEHWDEITIQLLDGSGNLSQSYMETDKFAGIVDKALEKLGVDTAARLFFEYAPDNESIRKLGIDSIDLNGDEIVVKLGNRKAVCKPFQRAQTKLSATEGTDALNTNLACCSGGAAINSSSDCCG